MPRPLGSRRCLLGEGVRLFGDTVETDLELTEVKTYENGFVELRYRLPRP